MKSRNPPVNFQRMSKYIFILIISTLTSCIKQKKPSGNFIDQPAKSSKTFSDCFANVDTSKAGQSIGCSAGIFKRINERYVIRLAQDFPIQFDSCYTVTIDRSNAKKLTELLVFHDKNATLGNICTDLMIPNWPTPIRRLYAESGQITVGFSNPTELYGNSTNHITVLIKKLVFIDIGTGEHIVLENELLWKVLNLGTPG